MVVVRRRERRRRRRLRRQIGRRRRARLLPHLLNFVVIGLSNCVGTQTTTQIDNTDDDDETMAVRAERCIYRARHALASRYSSAIRCVRRRRSRRSRCCFEVM
jgi:hypothetical protein